MINAWQNGRKIESDYKPFLDEYYNNQFIKWKNVDNILLQRRLGIDRIVVDVQGIRTTEDKYIKETCTYDSIFIETCQNTNIGSPGWIYKSRADELIYCLCNDVSIRIFHIHMNDLRIWFLQHQQKFLYHKSRQFNTKPEGYLVKIESIPSWILFKKNEIRTT